MKRVDFCRRNLNYAGRLAFDKLEREYPEIQVGLWGCIDECDLCVRHTIARVDRREVLTAPTDKELWEQLKRLIEDSRDGE